MKDESEVDRVQNREWIADLLGRVEFVAWDRFTVGEINDYQIVDVYGWIDRDDEYKDFVWSRFWPENENLEYTTSSDEHTKEIERIWFGEASAGHNRCRRVENTFDVDNAVVLDDPELVTDGGVDQSEAEAYQQYTAEYCEWCGTVESATSPDVEADLSDVLPETVARVGILQAIAEIAPQDINEPVAEVGETVATEEGTCSTCGEDAIVKRYYTTGSVPSVDMDIEPDEYAGRDPDEDALIETEPGKFREVSEVPGIDTEDLE